MSKGSRRRPTDEQRYRKNYEQVFGKKNRKDRLLDESDGTVQYVCGNLECGHIALADRQGALRCPVCGNNASVHPIQTNYAFKLLLDELLSLGVAMRLQLEDLR